MWSYAFEHDGAVVHDGQSDGTAIVLERPGGGGTDLVAVVGGEEAWSTPLPISISMQVSPTDDSIVVTGAFSDSANLGGGLLTSAGGLDAAIAVFNDDGTHRWSAIFGDAENQVFFYPTIAPDGTVTVLGSFNGTIDLGGGSLVAALPSETFVARFDGDGTHLLSRSLGVASGCGGLARVGGVLVPCNVVGTLTFDEVTIAGVSGQDMALFALDEAGEIEWHLPIVGPGDQSLTVGQFDADGAYVALLKSTEATTLGSLAISAGFSVVRISADGEPLSATLLPTGIAPSTGFAFHPVDGSFLVRSETGLRLFADDLTLIFEVEHDAESFVIAGNGDVLVARETSTAPGGLVERLSR